MKKVPFLMLALLLIFASLNAAWYLSKFKWRNARQFTRRPSSSVSNIELEKLHEYSSALKRYAERNQCNTTTAFLIDMKLESGSRRFFVYDLKNDSVSFAGLVTHGRCNENWLSGRKYGNQPGCGCTSLGKYKVGNPYYGTFGLAYKLHGLDSSNNNAYRRAVVLHGFDCVPDNEVKPYPICQSNGCPSVSPTFMKALKKIIDDSNKPVLMWIFE